jgi:HEAT repeat protein
LAKTKTVSFEETLAVISDAETDFSNAALLNLSNIELEPEKVSRFEQIWAGASLERRRKTIDALATLAEEDVQLNFNTVFMHLLKDSDPQVRAKAIEGLWEETGFETLNRLLELLQNDPNETVREKAALGLSNFAYLAETGKLKERFVEKLRKGLLAQVKGEQLDPTVGRRALEALGYFGQDEAIIKLIQKAYDSDDELVKASALKAMGRSVNKRWLPEVGKELSSDLPSLRYEAATAAGEIVCEELLPSLFHLVNDRDREVRMAAVWALGQIGGPEPTRVLKDLANGDNEAMAEAAKEALAEIAFAADALNVVREG